MINDPVVLVCEPEHDKPYYLIRGKETFYDENRVMRRWMEMEDAIEWGKSQGLDPLEHLPEDAKNAPKSFYHGIDNQSYSKDRYEIQNQDQAARPNTR